MLREGLKPEGVRRCRRLDVQRESPVTAHRADTHPDGSNNGNAEINPGEQAQMRGCRLRPTLHDHNISVKTDEKTT
jgi:hypothetical protein